MIIKIVGMCNKYHIYDNVSKVDYYINSRNSNIDGTITEQITDNGESITVKTSVESPIKYNWISFTNSNGTKESVIFDTVAYICNDSGKTIEIVRV